MSEDWKRTDLRSDVGGRTMRGLRHAGPGTIMMVGVIVLALGLLVGGIVGHLQTPSTVTTKGSDHLYLTVAYNPFTGLDEYFPANFTVPANVPVIITITNFDNGTNPIDPSFASVRGTVGGTETVTNATSAGVVLQGVPANQVAHTFTVEQSPYDINVPIPAAQDQTPTVVSFTVVFTAPGPYVWNCMAPCDDAAMSTPGFMTGTLTVVSD